MATDPPVSVKKVGKSKRRHSSVDKKSSGRSSSSRLEARQPKTVSFSASKSMIVKLDPLSAASVEAKEALKKSRRLSRKQQLLQQEPSQTTKKFRSHKHHDHKKNEKKNKNQEHRKHHEPKHQEQNRHEEENTEHNMPHDPPKHHEHKQQHQNNQLRQQFKRSDPPIPAVVPTHTTRVPIVSSPGTHATRVVPIIVSDDEDTLRTNRTQGTFNTMNSQVSLVSVQYSVASAWDTGSCGMGTIFSPFTTTTTNTAEGLHDRIRHQMEMACSNGYEGKGTRLTHLAAAQKTFQGDVDSSTCGRQVPLSFYGTLKAMKERFRSEAVAETCCGEEEKEPITVRLRKKLPSREELQLYASQAKQRLLDTIEALEQVRSKVGQTLGPTIEKLREETEKTCIQSDAWCRDNYTCLVATSAELHEQLANKTKDYLEKEGGVRGKVQDPPEGEDMSIIGDEIAPTEELYGSADQLILKRLKRAAASFLDHYAALLLSVYPAAASTDKGVVLELPDGFGQDGNKLEQLDEEHKVKVFKQEQGGEAAQDWQDSDDPDQGESEESEDPPETSEEPETEDTGLEPETEDTTGLEPETTDAPEQVKGQGGEEGEAEVEEEVEEEEEEEEEDPETAAALEALVNEVVSEDQELANVRDAPERMSRRAKDPDEGPGPREPDGKKPYDSNSVEESLTSSRNTRAKKGSKKVNVAKKSAKRAQKKKVESSASADTGERLSSSGANNRVEGNPSFGDSGAEFPINLVDSRDDSQSSRGQPKRFNLEEAAKRFNIEEAAYLDRESGRGQPKRFNLEEAAKRFNIEEAGYLDRESASVWKKLRKLTQKKKQFAMSMFGDMVNEIARDDVEIKSSHSGVELEDEASFITNGTEENPIVLIDDSSEIVERPKVDKRSSRKRRALAADRDAERLLGLEEQSQVSGLTAPTEATATTGVTISSKGEMKEELQEFVVEYLGSKEQRDESPNRLEAAEHVLTSLKAHMNDRLDASRGSISFLPMEDTETSELSRDFAGNPRILPISVGRRAQSTLLSKPIVPFKAGPLVAPLSARNRDPEPEPEPEIIDVIEDDEPEILHPPTINLVTTNSDILPPEEVDEEPQPVIVSHQKSKLLADPHRHAIIEEDEREEIAISHLKLTRPVSSNPTVKREMIDLTSLPADAAIASGYLNHHHRLRPPHPPPEQRDDQQGVTVHDVRDSPLGANQPQDDSTAFLYHDPRYHGDLDTEPRPPPPPPPPPPTPTTQPTPTTTGARAAGQVFRNKPPSFNSLPSDISDSKSITSSILGKRIPGRSKSVSFNLPDDDEDGVPTTTETVLTTSTTTTTTRSKKSSSRSRNSSTTAAAVAPPQTYDERAAAARRELARLSQRQATLVARGQVLTRK